MKNCFTCLFFSCIVLTGILFILLSPYTFGSPNLKFKAGMYDDPNVCIIEDPCEFNLNKGSPCQDKTECYFCPSTVILFFIFVFFILLIIFYDYKRFIKKSNEIKDLNKK